MAEGNQSSGSPPIELEGSAHMTTPSPVISSTRIEVSGGDGRWLVTLRGQVDAACRDEASLAMAQVMLSPQDVTVDASAVEFIDSSGIVFVLQMHRAVTEAGGTMTVLNPSPAVTQLLEFVGTEPLTVVTR